MKKLLKHFTMAACYALTCGVVLMNVGCKSVPTNSQMYTTSYTVGVAAALIANQTTIDDETRNAICDIMGKVQGVVPATNQTFEVAWTHIAEAHVQILISDGTIDQKQGELILAAFKVVVKGIDYVFYKYPKARTYEELTVAVIDGFCDGFLTVFKPSNSLSLFCGKNRVDSVTYDVEAYKYLQRVAK